MLIESFRVLLSQLMSIDPLCSDRHKIDNIVNAS